MEENQAMEGAALEKKAAEWMAYAEKEAGETFGMNLAEVGLPFYLSEGMDARFEKGALLISRGPLLTAVRVFPATGTNAEGTEDNPAVANAQVITLMTPGLASTLKETPGMMNQLNGLACGGALARNEHGDFYVGSRVTLFQKEGAWEEVLLPLLRGSILYGVSGILSGAMAMMQNGKKEQGEPSAWTGEDLQQAASLIPESCKHTCTDTLLSVEFSLGDGVPALLCMDASVTHPGMGSGLLSTLTLPLAKAGAQEREKVVMTLNRLEMYRESRAQHFGAWCWQENDALRYVSFFPNVMKLPSLTTCWPSVQAARAPWALNMAVALLRGEASK